MNIDKFDTWQYREDRNCWDYVREFLIEIAGVPEEDVPVFGICPDHKKEMTEASKGVERSFIDSGPSQYAVACHYIRGTLYHVGVVDNGLVRHTGRKTGTRKDKIKRFEAMAERTEYKLHRSLWRS